MQGVTGAMGGLYQTADAYVDFLMILCLRTGACFGPSVTCCIYKREGYARWGISRVRYTRCRVGPCWRCGVWVLAALGCGRRGLVCREREEEDVARLVCVRPLTCIAGSDYLSPRLYALSSSMVYPEVVWPPRVGYSQRQRQGRGRRDRRVVSVIRAVSIGVKITPKFLGIPILPLFI